jgi:hypothetical protein
MLSIEDNVTIERLKNLGWTWKNIGIAVDKKPETCRTFWKRYKLNKDLPEKTIIRKSIITGYMGLKIKEAIRDNPKISAQKIFGSLKNDLGEETALPSKSTIIRFLNENNWMKIVVSPKPL